LYRANSREDLYFERVDITDMIILELSRLQDIRMLILATDMTSHAKIMKDFTENLKNFDLHNKSHVNAVNE
jgi:hypothetical protein